MRLITQRSLVQIQPPQPKASVTSPTFEEPAPHPLSVLTIHQYPSPRAPSYTAKPPGTKISPTLARFAMFLRVI